VFSRNRDVNRERAVGTALAMLYKALCFIWAEFVVSAVWELKKL
jgi:hypothetical protein